MRLGHGAYAPCSSPKNYTNLSEEPHTFYMKAKDEAGNALAAQKKWTFKRADIGTG